ncbi:MAG: amidohydrolase [Candidatus Caldipriscus sp.]|nr:amidohydrolase [Candidatus Caldipriscus sp.]
MKFGVRFSYLLTMEDDGYIEDGFLVVEDDKIIFVGKYRETPEIPVIDTRPSIGLPTLINTHTHTAMVAYRGLADDLPLFKWLQEYIWPAEAKTVSEEMVRLSYKLAIAEMVSGGTGAINDMYFFQEVGAEVMEEIGFRGLLGEGLIDFPTPSFKKVEDGLKRVENQLRTRNLYKFVRFSVCLHAPYSCSPDLIKTGYELAREYDVPLHMHVAETLTEVEQIKDRFGKRPVEYLESLGVLHDKFIAAHSVHLEEHEMEIYRERGVKVAHNPQSNMKLASGIAPVDKYLEKGITVGLATDGCASNNDLDMFEEMRSAALLHKVNRMNPEVLNAKTVVKMATIYAAKVLGFEDIIGSLKVGKKADFIAVSLESPHMQPIYDPYSHLVYTAKASDVKWVFIDGKPLKRDGKLTFIDEEEILEIGRKLREMVLSALKGG